MSLVIAHTNGWMVEDKRVICDNVFLPVKQHLVKMISGPGYLMGFTGAAALQGRVQRRINANHGADYIQALDLACEAARCVDDEDSDMLFLCCGAHREQPNRLYHVGADGHAYEIDSQWWAIGWSNMARGWLAGYLRRMAVGRDPLSVAITPAIAQECIRWVSTQTGSVSADSTVAYLTE